MITTIRDEAVKEWLKVSMGVAPTDERYCVDFSPMLSNGWQQFDTDQDAWYFGVWVNCETRQTLSYAEGDWALTTAETETEFEAQLAGMNEFYGPPPPAAVSYGPGADGTWERVEYYDRRPGAKPVAHGKANS